MFINKMGYDHKEYGTNCQDYGIERIGESIICDGCSEGSHSEVGAKLFCHLYKEHRFSVSDCFNWLTFLIGDNPTHLRDFLSFTILKCSEDSENFIVDYCGDGYIILQDHNGNITFEEITDGEYPKYYIYNYISSEYMSHYKDGVSFTQKEYSKEQYQKVGIASDGLRFILQADDKLRNEFIECLKSGKEMKVKLFINRNYKIFKDDVTIIF